MVDPQRVLELLRAMLAEDAPVTAPPPEFMTAEEYGERIRATAATVRELVARGMPHVRPRPHMIRIKVAAADAWLEDRSSRPSGRAAAQKGMLQ